MGMKGKQFNFIILNGISVIRMIFYEIILINSH